MSTYFWNTPAALIMPGRDGGEATLRDAVLDWGRLSDEERQRADVVLQGPDVTGPLHRKVIEAYLMQLT